jgi:hypothetical protein
VNSAYPTVKLKKTVSGYATKDGRYTAERDTVSDIGSSNAGCYKPCWHVFRDGVRIAKFLDTPPGGSHRDRLCRRDRGDPPFNLTPQSTDLLKVALTVRATTDTKRGTSLAATETSK